MNHDCISLVFPIHALFTPVNSRIVQNPFQTGRPCLRATVRYVPKLNFKTFCFLYWGKNHITVNILLFCLHLSLLLCIFNLSSVINFVSINFCFPLWQLQGHVALWNFAQTGLCIRHLETCLTLKRWHAHAGDELQWQVWKHPFSH